MKQHCSSWCDMPATNYHSTWCSVVINVIYNTCFGSRDIVCYIGNFHFEHFFFKLSFQIMWEELYENCH
jgi:hypothetical protein